jgi:predicted chitinase
MAEQSRGQSTKKLIGAGPFLGVVTNHLDPTYMGAIEVLLLKGTTGDASEQGQTVIVQYLSPFYGVTSVNAEGNDSSSFDSVQKSYGMWMVPPDIGVTVMCIFVDGDINSGFWIGCVQDRFQNHMIPGIAASKFVEMTPAQEQIYQTRYLPVAEFHKRSKSLEIGSPDTFTKPIHPFADRLLSQGLLLDTIRGVTSSSARREVPSRVFGISTPGPEDLNTKNTLPVYNANIKVSRLGGSQFVMDDGDKEGQNELIRIRTRTGHQILLHNSADLIYIGNSKGSAWIELTSNGKIDVYAEDSISLRTEQDFNLRADRDVNIEAGRSLNLNAFGGMELNCVDRFYLMCKHDAKINIDGNTNWTTGASMKLKSELDSNWFVGTDLFVQTGKTTNFTSGDTTFITSKNNWDLVVKNDTLITTSGNVGINTIKNNNFTSGLDTNIYSASNSNFTTLNNTNIKSAGQHIEKASQIHMNGPTPTTAAQAATAKSATLPAIPLQPVKLEIFALPNRNKNMGWSNGKFYRTGNISSICVRSPTHEPWDQHENINPSQFTPDKTSRVISIPTDGPYVTGNAQTDIGFPTNTTPPNVPASKNASSNEAYLQAVLVNSGITDPIKLAAIMAQCKVESDLFKTTREYASGNEYENRKDLGNNQPGDGARYKGRGFIQLTGRSVYAAMTKYFNAGVDFTANPELVEGLEWAAKSVLYFFNVFKPKGFKNRTMTQPYQDTTAFWDDYLSVSALVNGGTNGLARRQQYYAEYKQKFTTQGITPAGTVGTGTGGVLTDSYGNPVRSGQGGDT